MTREEAIRHVLDDAESIAYEIAWDPDQRRRVLDQTRQALLALGVTQDEIEAAVEGQS